jgi:hypothetical protein
LAVGHGLDGVSARVILMARINNDKIIAKAMHFLKFDAVHIPPAGASWKKDFGAYHVSRTKPKTSPLMEHTLTYLTFSL